MPMNASRTPSDDRALFLVRTAFQASLCSKIAQQEGLEAYDVIFISRSNDQKDRRYHEALAAEAERSLFFRHAVGSGSLGGYVKALLRFPFWLLLRRYRTIYLAAFNIWYFRVLCRWVRAQRICTYDDGSGNYGGGASLLGLSDARDRRIGRLLGGDDVSTLLERSEQHFAINPRMENIVEGSRLVGIQLAPETDHAVSEGTVSIFLGQNLHEYLDVGQVEALQEFVRTLDGIYLPHPREDLSSYAAASGLEIAETPLIAEDYVAEILNSGKSVKLYGARSTVFLTVNDRRVEKVYLDSGDDPTWAELFQQAGCRVHRL